MSSPDNQELMRNAQAGDRDAFGHLYRRLMPTALRITRGVMPGETGRAHDAVQDGFLSVWRSRALYRPELGSVETWAYTVIRNRALDATRRHDRHDQRRDGLEELVENLSSVEHTAHEQVLASDAAGRVRHLLRELPVAQREVVYLTYYGQLSNSAIADHLGIPLGTVKSRLRLALDRLRLDSALAAIRN